LPSLTVNWNVKAPAVAGAVKVGDAVVPPVRVTVVPAVCVQLKVSVSASGSALPDPLSVTGVPTWTV
jgi:hypothetical protein